VGSDRQREPWMGVTLMAVPEPHPRVLRTNL